MTHKKITWTSWNAIADDYIESIIQEAEEIQQEMEETTREGGSEAMFFAPMLDQVKPITIHTPMGVFPLDSMWKPSDRWDCWIGTTNFSIRKSTKEILKEEIEGIEALKIMGRYTFFVGIPFVFDFTSVRQNIEARLCSYTEKEVLNEETQATVNLVKEQLQNKKHWSILVASTGKVDYVFSDKFDQTYLEGLHRLLEMKQSLGGIILRGNHG
jgi:hypothetical protein